MRTRAKNIGIMTTIAAFGLNEVARLTMRSRKYLTCPLTNEYLMYSNVQAETPKHRFLRPCSIHDQQVRLPGGHQR